MSIDDVVGIAWISEVALSTRGDLSYSLTRPDPERNKNVGEVRVRRPDGTEFYLVGEGDSNVRWDPGGRRIAFTSRRGASKEEKGVGVFLWGVLGEPRRLAWFKLGVEGLEWFNESTLAINAGTGEEGYHDPDGDYVATSKLPLWLDGAGLVAGKTTQIHLLDVDSGRISKLTSEPNGVTTLIKGFEVCGGYVYYVTPPDWRKPLLHSLKRVDSSGNVEELVSGVSVYQLKCVGGELYLLAHRLERGISSHYKLWSLDGGRLECLTCGLDRDQYFIIGGDKGRVEFLYADRGRTVLAAFDGGSIEKVLDEKLFISGGHYESGMRALVIASPKQPPEVYMLGDGGLKRVTSVNEWVRREVGLYEPSRVEVSVGGRSVEGWVIDPEPGREGKPLILYIHGGPKAMYGYGFYPEMQLMASKGFIVAYANPTGSNGYTEEFADIRGKYGEVDFEDLEAFLSRVIEEYKADRSRVVVTGISYGGYMANVMAAKSRLVSAAISENGIADWISDYWASDIGFWFGPDQIGGSPLENIKGYVDKSPAYWADKVKAPMLFIHSMEDYRCFIDQSLAMHTALLMRGKDSTILVFTKGAHGHSILAEPRHRKKRLEFIMKWLEEKLRVKTSSPAREP